MANPTLEHYSYVFYVLTIHIRSTSYSNEDDRTGSETRRSSATRVQQLSVCVLHPQAEMRGSCHGIVVRIVASMRHTRRPSGRHFPRDLVP